MKVVLVINGKMLMDCERYQYIEATKQGEGWMLVGFSEPAKDEAELVETIIAFYAGDNAEARCREDISRIASVMGSGLAVAWLNGADDLTHEEASSIFGLPRGKESVTGSAKEKSYKPATVRLLAGDSRKGYSLISEIAKIKGHRIKDVQMAEDGTVAIMTGEVPVE